MTSHLGRQGELEINSPFNTRFKITLLERLCGNCVQTLPASLLLGPAATDQTSDFRAFCTHCRGTVGGESHARNRVYCAGGRT